MAQHARTAALLGVDFLPLGTPPVGLQSQPQAMEDTAPVASSQQRGAGRSANEPNFKSSPGASAPATGTRAVAQTGQLSAGAASISVDPIGIDDLRDCYQSMTGAEAQLDALRSKYETESPHQHFNPNISNIVFGEGDPFADLMFVGEAPGEDEDQAGRPFVGRAGQLLEKMIGAMGLSRESVYITNVLKTLPPSNGTPTKEEMGLCRPYLGEQIRIIEPKVIVTLGVHASQMVLGATSPMRSMRGQWHQFPGNVDAGSIFSVHGFDGLAIAVMPTYHPAYLLRSYTEENRRNVWGDLTQVMDKLGLSK